jgi:predicted CXXCH cytochrome family protein
MKRTNGPLAHRAGPPLVAVTLVAALALAFLPLGPAPVIALTSPDPSAAPADSPTPDPGLSPAPDPTPSVTPDPTPSPAPDPTPAPDPAASPTPDTTTGTTTGSTPDTTTGSTPDTTTGSTPDTTAGTTPTPTPKPTPPPAVKVGIAQTSNAPDAGRHRVDPGSILRLEIGLTPEADVSTGTLVEVLPPDWAVADASGGTYDAEPQTISWELTSLKGGETVSRTIDVNAPLVSATDGTYVLPASFAVRFDQGANRTDGPSLDVLVAPRVVIDHRTLGQVDRQALSTTYLALDAPIIDQQRFDVFRTRFTVHNPDSAAVEWTPQLEYRDASTGTEFVAVPTENIEGVAFRVSHEWIANPGPDGGTMPGPDGETIAAATLVADETTGTAESPVDGHHSMGVNPLEPSSLPQSSFTVVEFSARATVDAAYLTEYEFRVTDAGQPLAGAVTAILGLGREPPLLLTPGQRDGLPADEPAPEPVVDGALLAAALAPAPTRYALVAPVAGTFGAAGVLGPSALGSTGSDPIHGPYSLTTDACAACHKTHTAVAAPTLLAKVTPQYNLCITCHDGSAAPDAGPDIKIGYDSAPANDPATRSYYQHDPTAGTTGHTSNKADEFAGVSNRHSECADCHNPHRADSTNAVQEPDGWTASGRLIGASGVSVSYGTTGTEPPTYTPTTSLTHEYELCLKCHSGFTELQSNIGQPPSRHTLDKGIEFNPANGSYHPVEAAGTNGTAVMQNNLRGTSPFKQWNFSSTSTIRCLNCHASSKGFDTSLPTGGAAAVAAGDSLPAHSSANRGILIQNYQDRQLNGSRELYSSGDFALCLVCHAEAPFVDATGTVRNVTTEFSDHGRHILGIGFAGGTGTDIDTPGAGGGNAICAECHFRIHSTALANNPDDRSNSRLVNFAPNVTGLNGLPPTWTKGIAGQRPTCTLTCHGQEHDGEDYGRSGGTLVIAKTPTPTTYSAVGEVITYGYLVTNVGAGALPSQITVTDDKTTVSCPAGGLPAYATISCSATYVITSGDVTAGSVTNTATAQSGSVVSLPVSATVRRVP